MTIGQFALQQTIYNTLNNDSTLKTTLGCPVFDDVPSSQDYPFATIGEETSTEFGTKDLVGSQTTVNLHVWSQYKGAREVKNIMDRIHTLLHDTSLSVTGFNLVNLRFEFADTLRDPDGITRHGVMRFRAVMIGTA
tara:strand:+ start:889 stop:1296 length:408 start_codon:yes stop_codon:yes gene_type:complete